MADLDIDDDDMIDPDCPNCGGEGYVFDCMDESGCDYYVARCDWCNPRRRRVRTPSDRDGG